MISNKKDLQWIPMQKVRSSGSYPDLLEMVTRSGSPSSRDHAGMYAKVGGMSMYTKVGIYAEGTPRWGDEELRG